MDLSGFVALTLAIFAIFAVWMIFPVREFGLVASAIIVSGALIAFYLRRRSLRQIRDEQMSLLTEPEQEFKRPNPKTSSSRYERIAKQALKAKCPYCQNAFTSIEQVTFCEKCKALHHLDCWNSNFGCGVFGCAGKMAGRIEAYIRN